MDISKYLHLSDNTKQPARELSNYKLCKLVIFPEIINEIFCNSYYTENELSIDEQMICSKSRISFVHMQKNLKKFGIKAWKLCEGFHIYFDNCYTNFTRLVSDLVKRNNHSCGTVRIDKGCFPITFKKEKFNHDNE